MIDGERRGYMAGAEAIVPLIEEFKESNTVPRIPTDEELAKLAADAWLEYQSRGMAHIEPREAFLRGYAMACRGLLIAFTQEEVTRETIVQND